MKSLLVKMALLEVQSYLKEKRKKTVERPINKLYPVDYFNEFTIPVEDENI